MSWSDYWTPIRYGVAGVVGLTIAAVSYLALVGDEYVTVDAYAEVLMGTVERCQATATAGPTITTNTTTNVTFGYAADPSGRCWGGTNVYLVPVITTNVVTAVMTNWTLAAPLPAVVTVERITVGRVAAVVTNGGAVYTNDSPAVLTNGMTNAITPYIPAGAIETLQAAAEAAVPYYCNTSTAGLDAWTVTGMFAACGFPGGWDTNAGAEYVAVTNFAQLYLVLSKLKHVKFSAPVSWTAGARSKKVTASGSSSWPFPPTGQSYNDAKQKAEASWAGAVAAAEESNPDIPFRVYSSLVEPFVSDYRASVRHQSLRPVVLFSSSYNWHPLVQWATNSTMTFRYVATTNWPLQADEERIFDAQGCSILLGTNEITLPIIETFYSNSIGKQCLVFEPLIRLPNPTFDLVWPSDPSPQGRRATRGFVIGDPFYDGFDFADPMVLTIGFLYCTNAP